jgi:chemotaxis protein histidine kinase CheA
MTDWKQITARIRRARTGKDPAGQLSALFAKTRDAMVAFELARYFESTKNNEDAGKWYLTAAERFRRADWKTKAQEAATRLGATVAAEIPALPPKEKTAGESEAKAESESAAEKPEAVEPVAEAVAAAETAGPAEELQTEPAPTAQTASSPLPARRRGRGRRGGRDHQRPNRAVQAQAQSQSATSPSEPAVAPPVTRATSEERASNTPPLRSLDSMAESSASFSLRGRSGDPGLSSRLSQLEMNFRRLLACSPSKLDDAAVAPAGPGVWILSDEDLSTYYYVESCKTLRVAIGQLLRGSARSGLPIKPQLAEHLGIPETRVAKYLSDHCVVRWLQMDDDASNFAHFLIAVLRPTLNE